MKLTLVRSDFRTKMSVSAVMLRCSWPAAGHNVTPTAVIWKARGLHQWLCCREGGRATASWCASTRLRAAEGTALDLVVSSLAVVWGDALTLAIVRQQSPCCYETMAALCPRGHRRRIVSASGVRHLLHPHPTHTHAHTLPLVLSVWSSKPRSRSGK